MRKVTVAAIQMACSPDAAENRRTAEAMVRQAAGNGAQIILLPELFETPYFCQERRYASYDLATTPAENPAIAQLRKVAAELQVSSARQLLRKSRHCPVQFHCDH